MKNIIALCVLAAVVCCFTVDQAAAQNSSCPTGTCPNIINNLYASAQSVGYLGSTPLEKQIIQIEKDALDKWYKGDPSGYIDILAKDVGYFEPTVEKRLDGKEPLAKMFEALRGRVHAEKFDMLNTRVQAAGDSAVLSFNLISIEGGIPYRWNCTEIFAQDKDGKWKIIHSHWSQTRPQIR